MQIFGRKNAAGSGQRDWFSDRCQFRWLNTTQRLIFLSFYSQHHSQQTGFILSIPTHKDEILNFFLENIVALFVLENWKNLRWISINYFNNYNETLFTTHIYSKLPLKSVFHQLWQTSNRFLMTNLQHSFVVKHSNDIIYSQSFTSKPT